MLISSLLISSSYGSSSSGGGITSTTFVFERLVSGLLSRVGGFWIGSRIRGRAGDPPVRLPLTCLLGEWWTDSTVFSDSALELLATLLRLLFDIGGLPVAVPGWFIALLVDLNDEFAKSCPF